MASTKNNNDAMRPEQSAKSLALSKRSGIDSFLVMDVMRDAAREHDAGRDVIHMEVGQPGTPAPQAAREAAARALETETLGYTLALGDPPLRERIAKAYRDNHALDISPDRIIITTGSSAAFVLAFLALFDQGDTVALPQPGYPCYRQILKALGQSPVALPTDPETRWMPTATQIAQTIAATNGTLKGLLIASPANPTGSMITPQRLEELTGACAQNGTWFLSDEIYHGLTYETPAATALQFNDDAIVINSFSKYYSMTGWRIGWMVVPEQMVPTFERLAQNLYISPPAISQKAACAAFDATDELNSNKQTYAKNRALLLEELPALGFTKIAPADGAFYLYCDVSHMTGDSVAFAQNILKDLAIAVTPGTDFDPDNGHRFIRFSYATTHKRVRDAIDRLKEWPTLKQ